MASFDVTKLFTSVPLDETIAIVISELVKDGYNIDTLVGGNFKQFLELAVKDCIFLFNGKSYIQVDGVAMGSPLGPTLANAFMSYYEKIWLEDCPSLFKPVFYRRYVDDTFVVFKSNEHIELFLDYLNSKHQNIKFTFEKEENNSLSFLDVMITRKDGRFETSVFRKPTFTGLGMKFTSFLPLNYKLNLIQTLVHRAFKISSSYNIFHYKEIIFITNYFINNGFPISIIERMIGKTVNKLVAEEPPPSNESSSKFVVGTFHFYGKQSHTFSHKLQALVSQHFEDVKVRLVFKAARTLGSFFPFKDRAPLDIQSGIVYQYSCGECNSSYIGQTGRHFRTRIAEHRGLNFRTGTVSSAPLNSAIRDHSLEAGHPISVDGFKILHKGEKGDLTIIESLYIYSLKPSLVSHSRSTELVTV